MHARADIRDAHNHQVFPAGVRLLCVCRLFLEAIVDLRMLVWRSCDIRISAAKGQFSNNQHGPSSFLIAPSLDDSDCLLSQQSSAYLRSHLHDWSEYSPFRYFAGYSQLLVDESSPEWVLGSCETLPSTHHQTSTWNPTPTV